MISALPERTTPLFECADRRDRQRRAQRLRFFRLTQQDHLGPGTTTLICGGCHFFAPSSLVEARTSGGVAHVFPAASLTKHTRHAELGDRAAFELVTATQK
jgi:hypothetical protein